MKNSQAFLPDPSVSLFVKSVQVFTNDEEGEKTMLPFYADGYPGIMFQQTEKGLYVLPHNKQMPLLFLYGQTIHPIELQLEGSYKLIVFQLYPFVLSSFFGVNPADLNDGCYDLAQVTEFNTGEVMEQLIASTDIANWNKILTAYLAQIFEAKKEKIDFKMQQAIQLIIENEGRQPVKALREALHMTERTFERNFTAQTGVSPKQFSKMIQFQLSLDDLTRNDYTQLTDIVYKNGFSDQSHFIRVFKAFTGKTPAKFNSGNS